MIEVSNLVKKYGDHTAVDHLSFQIEKGKIYGFLGPNGAGKSTTMNMITGYIASTEGTVTIDGHDILDEPEEAKKCIGYLPEQPPLYFDMTVLEYMKFVADLKKIPKDKKASMIEEVMDMVKISDMRNRLIKNLSKGYRQRVGLAEAIMGYPEVIILDEPTVAVDPQSRNRILEGIQELNRQGATIVYTSHYMEEVEQICSRIAIMDHGRSIAVGTKEQLTGMIKTGEKVTIEAVVLSEEQLAGIRELPHVFAVDYQNDILTVQCTKARHNLVRILHCLEEQGTAFGRVYSELPTLNDVFLEITGKQLRD